jgi:hypothetical protein
MTLRLTRPQAEPSVVMGQASTAPGPAPSRKTRPVIFPAGVPYPGRGWPVGSEGNLAKLCATG